MKLNIRQLAIKLRLPACILATGILAVGLGAAKAQTATSVRAGDYCPITIPPAGASYGSSSLPQTAATSNNQSGQNSSSIQAKSQIAQIALREEGYQGTKNKNGSGGHGDCTKYYGSCVQWCGAFVIWVYKQAGYSISSGSISSRGILSWFAKNHSTFTDPSQAVEGNIVAWSRGGSGGHIGIVVKNDTATRVITTVEGNSSTDQVKVRKYSYSAIKTAFSGLLGFGSW